MKAFLGILHLRSGVLLTFNSGYIDPVIKSKNGNTSFIKGPFSSLLGASSDSTFIPLPLPLNSGDKIYFYSSDTIELSNAQGEKYGRERLLDIIYSAGNKADEVIKSIRQDVTGFRGESSLDADNSHCCSGIYSGNMSGLM